MTKNRTLKLRDNLPSMYERYKAGEFGPCLEDGTRSKKLVMKDGDRFFIIGPTFTNLQESDDYAFGSDLSQALFAYNSKMGDTRTAV